MPLPFPSHPLFATVLLASGAAALAPLSVLAQSRDATQAVQDYDLPASALAASLNKIARQAGVALTMDATLAANRNAAPVRGRYDAAQALRLALAGSGLELLRTEAGGYTLRAALSAPAGARDAVMPEVSVSGVQDDALPGAYAGGQIARGSRLGVLGTRDVMDTPFAATSYTEELLRNQQARSLGDVLANDPSIASGWPRDSYIDQPHVRGFNVLAEDISYGGLFGVAPATKIPMETIERVEVLKGTSAFLAGIAPGGSIGAIINLVPKRAGDEPLTRLTGSYDSRAQFSAHLDVGRRFGDKQQFGVRANAVYRDGETALKGSDKTMGTASLGLDYRGGALRASLDLGYDHLDMRRGGWWYFLDSNGFEIPKPPTRNTTQRWNYAKSTTEFGMTRIEYDLAPGLTAYAALGAQHAQQDKLSPEPIIGNSTGDFTEYFSSRPSLTKSRSGEAGLRGVVRTGALTHELHAGASGTWQKIYSAREYNGELNSNLYAPVFVDKPVFVSRLGALPLTSQSTLTSFAIADTITMLDGRLQLMGGARHQRVDVASYRNGVKTAYDKSALTPGVGIVFKPVANVSLCANSMQALNKGPVAPDMARNAGEIFSPFKSRQYEAGVKVDTGDYLTTVSVFQVKQPNGQLDTASMIYGLFGEQRNRGLEASIVGEPVKGWRVMAGAMLLDAVLTATPQGKFDGDRAPGVSRLNVNLGSEWDTPFAPGLTVTGRITHAGSQYAGSGNLQQIPAWTILDLGARYTLRLQDVRPVVLRANLDNVFDRRYWASAAGVGGGWLNVGSPRSARFSAQVDF